MSGNSSSAKSIFLRAVESHTPEEWATYLDDACGNDQALRRRVDALLEAHGKENRLLDISGAVATAAFSWTTEEPGTQIGPYRLLEPIGEGGFGVVYLAEQEHPIKRRVALKIIKPGMDTRQAIARFEAERQALAMMDHPNIAKVHDAGATDNSRPYFVMELVQGVPITEYCDQCDLTIRERLHLFITVCQAVQHAHQKGIIHRDIKPTNVLVAIQDGKPAPKIIDFGVAKAINQQLTEHTLTTGFAQIIGSPLYMSPEQAELSPLGVDTRTDIYSLGVLLYELLTGTTPFEASRLKEASFDELRRIIREEEPPRPSARFSTLAAEVLSTVTERRRAEPRRLIQALRGDLDWIVMKCLDKDRNRRYGTVNGLARDIECHLTDEPVQACPPSAAYRFRKFVRRNKIAMAFVSLLVIAVAGLAVSNVRIKQNEQRAIVESETSNEISHLLLSMLASANPDATKGSDYTVRQLLDDFSARIANRLGDRPEVKATILATIGNAYRRLGLHPEAEPHLQSALQLRRQIYGNEHERVADSLLDWAWNLSGQWKCAEAELAVREAVENYRLQGVKGPKLLSALRLLAHTIQFQWRFSDAEIVADEALAVAEESGNLEHPEVANILHERAFRLNSAQKHAEAEQLARRAVEMHRRLHGSEHPETAHALRTLGFALAAQGRHSEASSVRGEALLIFRRYYSLDYTVVPETISELREGLLADGKLDDLQALAHRETGTVDAETAPIISAAWVRRAKTHAAFKQWNHAAVAYGEAIRVKPDIAEAWHNRGRAHASLGRFDEALADYSKSIELNPENAEYRRSRGRLYGERFGRYDEAIADLSRAIDLGMTDWLLYARRGEIRYQHGSYKEGIADLSRAAELLANGDATCRAIVCNQLAWFLATCPNESYRDAARAVDLAAQAVELNSRRGDRWNTLGAAHYAAKNFDIAVEALQTSMNLNDGGNSFDWFLMAMAEKSRGNDSAAQDWYDKAVDWMGLKAPKDAELLRFCAEAERLLGITHSIDHETSRGTEVPAVDDSPTQTNTEGESLATH